MIILVKCQIAYQGDHILLGLYTCTFKIYAPVHWVPEQLKRLKYDTYTYNYYMYTKLHILSIHILHIFHYTVVFKNPVEDKFSSVAVRYELLGLIHRRGLIGKLNLTRTFSCASLSRQYKQHYHITVQYRL